ncbi:MAG: tyrosine-type recombinase/integrase [Pseudomonadota bacterium]
MKYTGLQFPTSHKWASQLNAIFARCEGAYSDLTLSGYRKDLDIFAEWCLENNAAFLPASPSSVAGFFDDQLQTCRYATIRRRASAIRFAHNLSDLPCPIEHSDVFLSMRRAARMKGRRPKQVLGLTRPLLDKMIVACPETLAGARDAALLSIGYDTLCRSSELSWMRIEDVQLEQARIYIPRAKNDPFGDGRFACLTPSTRERVSLWLQIGKLECGALFRGLHTGSVSERNLDTSSIRRIVKSAARRAGLTEEAMRLSGHSMRVGAAQDLMRMGYNTIEIMTAGGWKNSEVVARYVETSAFRQKMFPLNA